MENLEMVRGDTFEFNIEIEGLTQDLTSASFAVKKNIDDVSYVVRKTLGNGITKDTTLSSDNCRVYKVRVEASDTNNVDCGDYYYDLQVGANTDDIFTPLRGTLKINWDITR